MKIKQGISESNLFEVLEWAYKFFNHLMGELDFYGYMLYVSSWEHSFLLLDDNDEIMGVYILGMNQVTDFIDSEEYGKLNGVEGVLLAVDESIRGLGWGNKLKEIPKTLGFDYIWGQQLKDLNNLEDWLKRRVLVATTDQVYVTLEKYHND